MELLQQWVGSERVRRLDAAEVDLCAAVLQLEAFAGLQGSEAVHGNAAAQGGERREGRQGTQASNGGLAEANGGAVAAGVGDSGGGREAGEGDGVGEALQGGPGADPNWSSELEARVVAARVEFAEAWAAAQHVLEVRGARHHATLTGSLDGNKASCLCLQRYLPAHCGCCFSCCACRRHLCCAYAAILAMRRTWAGRCVSCTLSGRCTRGASLVGGGGGGCVPGRGCGGRDADRQRSSPHTPPPRALSPLHNQGSAH